MPFRFYDITGAVNEALQAFSIPQAELVLRAHGKRIFKIEMVDEDGSVTDYTALLRADVEEAA